MRHFRRLCTLVFLVVVLTGCSSRDDRSSNPEPPAAANSPRDTVPSPSTSAVVDGGSFQVPGTDVVLECASPRRAVFDDLASGAGALTEADAVASVLSDLVVSRLEVPESILSSAGFGVVAFLRDPLGDVESLRMEVASWAEVDDAVFVSKEDSLYEALFMFQGDPDTARVFAENPGIVPASIRVQAVDPASYEAIEQRLGAMPEVERVVRPDPETADLFLEAVDRGVAAVDEPWQAFLDGVTFESASRGMVMVDPDGLVIGYVATDQSQDGAWHVTMARVCWERS